jgi:hypothetical protein
MSRQPEYASLPMSLPVSRSHHGPRTLPDSMPCRRLEA